jgi:hypothetical protein
MTDTAQPTFNPAAFVDSMRQFQQQWRLWMIECYPTEIIDDPKEALRRFAEESFEMMQSLGMTKEEVLFMLDYVYVREKGEPSQEAAGALNCLVTLCNQQKIDLGQTAMADLTYCWENVSQIRDKNALKPKPEPFQTNE